MEEESKRDLHPVDDPQLSGKDASAIGTPPAASAAAASVVAMSCEVIRDCNYASGKKMGISDSSHDSRLEVENDLRRIRRGPKQIISHRDLKATPLEISCLEKRRPSCEKDDHHPIFVMILRSLRSALSWLLSWLLCAYTIAVATSGFTCVVFIAVVVVVMNQ